MKKLSWILCSLALPMAVMAAEGAPREGHAASNAGSHAGAHVPSAADAASAAEHQTQLRSDVRRSKDRGSKMGACHKTAADQGLQGDELKAALVNCMKQP